MRAKRGDYTTREVAFVQAPLRPLIVIKESGGLIHSSHLPSRIYFYLINRVLK